MKLVSITLVKDEEFWIWYVLTALHPFVDRMLVFDNGSRDATLPIIRSMAHVRDKLELREGFLGDSEDQMREATLEAARAAGATHALIADGDEVWPADDLAFCRRLLESVEHRAPQPFPADPSDPPGASGAVIRHLGVRPLHPSYAAPGRSAALDWRQPETDHGCYNFAVRFMALDGLIGNRREWRHHGYVDSDGFFVQASPHTLWLPRIHYFHFMLHPRSERRYDQQGFRHWRPMQDLGANPMPAHVRIPEVFSRLDGPANPTLKAWGLR